jgi:hypothetical protein
MNAGKRGLASAAMVLAMSIGTPATAATCGDVTFADTAHVGGSSLVLNGLGIRTATIFNVEVYVAGLYIPEKSVDADAILASNEPWRLMLKFVHDADASEIRDAFLQGFERVTGGNLAPLKDRMDRLDTQIVDIKEGEYLSFTYDPSTAGLTIDLNGMSGTIEGADFADAILSMSLGPNPPNPTLKAGLLGGPCEVTPPPALIGD